MLERPILYAAIGDSLTVGVGSFFAPGFVKQYSKISETVLKNKIIYRKFAKNGATSRDILRILERPNTQRSIVEADVITITAGGNDLIDAGEIFLKTSNQNVFLISLAEAKRNISYMLNLIAAIKGEKYYQSIIRIVNLYNPNPHIPESTQWISQYNSYLNSLQSANIRVADAYSVFYHNLDELLTFDHIHPNGEGYQAIAHQLYLTGYSPLINY